MRYDPPILIPYERRMGANFVPYEVVEAQAEQAAAAATRVASTARQGSEPGAVESPPSQPT